MTETNYDRLGAALSTDFHAWCGENDLPQWSADELLDAHALLIQKNKRLTEEQAEYLKVFIKLWNTLNENY